VGAGLGREEIEHVDAVLPAIAHVVGVEECLGLHVAELGEASDAGFVDPLVA